MNQFNNVQEEQENEDDGSDGNPNRNGRKPSAVQSLSNQHAAEGVTSQPSAAHEGFDTNNIP